MSDKRVFIPFPHFHDELDLLIDGLKPFRGLVVLGRQLIEERVNPLLRNAELGKLNR
jgi:hypothetical protein